MKTIFVFLMSFTIGLALPNPVWAHGGGGSSSSAGGGGSSSSAGGGGHGGSSSAGNGGNTNGAAHGRGFGHANIGNPGHNALSARSSHSQNTSRRGGTPDGRSFSNHTHTEHSLAQHHLTHTTKADQAVQVDDQDPGKAKGFVDSLPSNQEPQADLSVTLNPSLENDVAIGLQPSREPNVDRGRTLNLETMHLGLAAVLTPALQSGQGLQADSSWASDPDKIVALKFQQNQELQADGGWKLNPDTTHSGLDETVTRGLRSALALKLPSLHPGVPDTDDTPVTKFPNRIGLQDWSALPTNPELDDDDVLGWRLVPFYGLVLVFLVAKVFSRQGIPRVFQRNTIRQPPNPCPNLDPRPIVKR